MYSVANSPPLAKAWYLRLDIEKVIKVCEVVAVDSETLLKEEPVEDTKDFPEPTEYEDPNQINMVNMKVAGNETLRCLAFGVHSESYPTSIRTTYPGQLVAKVDAENTSLIFELFEATPYLEPFYEWPISDEKATKIAKTFYTNPGEVSDNIDTETVDPATDKIRYFFMDAFSHFRETRVLRLRLALHNIKSIALLKEPVLYTVGDKIDYLSDGVWCDGTILKTGPFLSIRPSTATDPDDSRLLLHQHVRPKRTLTGVLVVTSSEPAESFSARCVFSETMSYNEFEFCGDWTPDQAASESLRQYVVGDIPELETIIAEMCRVSPHLCDRIQGPKSGINDTLVPVETPALEETRPPHLRRCPLFGPIDGLEELNNKESSPSLIAGQDVGLAEQLIKSADEREQERSLLEEKAAVSALCGLQEDPNFVFPSVGTEDPLLAAAEEFAKTGSAPRSLRFLNPTVKSESEKAVYEDPVEEEKPAPPPTAQLVKGKCSGCQRDGLLPWVRRCPGCGVALVQKIQDCYSSNAEGGKGRSRVVGR
eukprot:TRINITY_DN16432_c0_g2_i2.p1 TRINITY_DN16432_c0_g2~~TRINITY_DN16432_c0_g2_i2.p1  ORF type:complete len:575 (+),score=111.93 TRINITY_DN16432_c0_g2_i2:116-1726(+)